MNKRIVIAFAIVQILLIGSLLAIASSNNEQRARENEIDEICTGDCNNCDEECDRIGFCNSQGKQNCDGTGTCSQMNQRNTNCNSICDGTGTCTQNTQQGRNCNPKSSCSGICNN